jgi:hypothetical protein
MSAGRVRGWLAVGLMGGGTLFVLFGCTAPAPIAPAEQARVDSDTARIEHKIAAACLGSGLFKMADGAVAAALPAAEIPVVLVNAGVDLVCADPARFAGDVSTIEWLGRHLREAIAKHRGT